MTIQTVDSKPMTYRQHVRAGLCLGSMSDRANALVTEYNDATESLRDVRQDDIASVLSQVERYTTASAAVQAAWHVLDIIALTHDLDAVEEKVTNQIVNAAGRAEFGAPYFEFLRSVLAKIAYART